jgi:hypothetical protein
VYRAWVWESCASLPCSALPESRWRSKRIDDQANADKEKRKILFLEFSRGKKIYNSATSITGRKMSNEYALTREQMLASAQQELAAFQDMYNRYAK